MIRSGPWRPWPGSGQIDHHDGDVVGSALTLGFVGQVSQSQLSEDGEGLRRGDIVGKSGMERQYDREIRGSRGWKVVSVNNLGRRMGSERVDPANGMRWRSPGIACRLSSTKTISSPSSRPTNNSPVVPIPLSPP